VIRFEQWTVALEPMSIRAGIARRLEGGTFDGPLAELASRAWGAMARVHTPLQWREDARVVVVGGSTLGGSGKTPLALACAEELNERGARVALVGHGYGATPGPARLVAESDDVRLVGDEALVCKHHLSARGIPVSVASTRQQALDLALSLTDVAVVDGPCQTRPRRATLALLAVNATDPWGAGWCPPRGDLRAPLKNLLAAVDRIVAIAPEDAPSRCPNSIGAPPVDLAWIVSNGATLEGKSIGWRELSRSRIGLWTALARPGRIVATLARRGVYPVVVRECGDHGPARVPRRSPYRGIDLWVCTSKCRRHLPASLWGAPVATLDCTLRLEDPLKAALARLDPKQAHPIS
jgi:tetraacyldisaccharide 4'-kinase